MNKLEEEVKEPLVMAFTNNAYHDIVNTIGRIPAESGGLLFGYLEDYVVREFVYDEHAYTTGSSYTFNTDYLNGQIKRLWEEKGLACIGFIHSHPFNFKVPSSPDMFYFRDMFKYMPREKYLVPIISTIPDGGFNLNPCILINGDRAVVIADKIELVVESHVSKYGHIINPPKVVETTEIVETENNFVRESDIIGPVFPNIKAKNIIKNIFSDILYGLFSNTKGGKY